MRRRTLYRALAVFALAVSVVMVVLAAVALGLSSAFEASAAAACAVLFFIPGLAFLNQARRLRARDLALAHVGQLAQERGVTDAETMGKDLGIPAKDAEKILTKAIAEGYLQGAVDADKRFVAADAPHCPSCHAAVPRNPRPDRCPACGAALTGG